jgi:serine/threonine protein kinase
MANNGMANDGGDKRDDQALTFGGINLDDHDVLGEAQGSPSAPVAGHGAGGAGDGMPGASAWAGKTQQPMPTTAKMHGLTDPRRYKVKSEFARGGMGRILLATDRALGREVAVKELLGTAVHDSIDASLPGTGATGASLDPNAIPRTTPADAVTLERFLREARITSRLEHPNIVPVYEIAQRPNGSWYYTMKVVRGKTLAARLREISQAEGMDDAGRLAERLKLLRPFVDVCNAVAYAHSQKVVHRDLKPENVMLGGFGETVLLDWGLALLEGEDPAAISHALSTHAMDKAKAAQKDADTRRMTKGSSTRLTLDGAVLGTPAYMAPEQARGELSQVDFLSDVWSLGAILYEILSGKRAYETEDLMDLIELASKGEYRPLVDAAPDVPPELAGLVARAMRPERGARMRSARELAGEVEAWIAGRALKGYRYSAREQLSRLLRRHKAAFATAAAAVLLLVGGGVWAYSNIAHERDTATGALNERDAEQKRREAAELDAAQKSEEVYQKLLAERKADIAAAAQKAERLPLPATVAAARAQLDGWKDRKPGDESAPLLKAANQEAVGKLVGSIGMHEPLFTLRAQPVAGRMVDFATPAEMERAVAELRDAKLLAVELAAKNGDYALAWFLYAWVAHEGNAMPLEALARVQAAGALVQQESEALPLRRKERIEAALSDTAKGLWRKDRAFNAPLMDDFVAELAGFQDQQTVDRLGAALTVYAVKARWREGVVQASSLPEQPASKMPAPQADILWTQEESDQITLCCRVLGRLQMGESAAAALAPFAAVVTDHTLCIEVGLALGSTKSAAAWPVAIAMRDRLGADSQTWRAMRFNLRQLPMPALPANADATACHNRGMARADMGDLDGAIADFTHAIELNPNSAASFVQRGLAHRILGDSGKPGEFSAAIADYTSALHLNGRDKEALKLRGDARQKSGDPKGGIDDCNAALDIDPEYAHAYKIRGDAKGQHGNGDSDEAIKDYTIALDLDPLMAPALISRGVNRAIKARRDPARDPALLQSALTDLNRAVELAPTIPDAFRCRGNIRITMEDIEGALNDFTRTLELTPRDIYSMVNRSFIRINTGDLEGTVQDCTRALSIDPNLGLALWNRTVVRRDTGVYEGAIADLTQLIENPAAIRSLLASSPAVLTPATRLLDYRGLCREAAGQYGEALADFEQAKAQGGTEKSLLANLERLKAVVDAKAWLGKPAEAPLDRLEKARIHAASARGTAADENLRVAVEEAEKALDALKGTVQVPELTKQIALTLDTLGWAFAANKRHAEAYHWFTNALEYKAGLLAPATEAYHAASAAAWMARISSRAESAAAGTPADTTVTSAEWSNRAFAMLSLATDLGFSNRAFGCPIYFLRSDPRWKAMRDRIGLNTAKPKDQQDTGD